MFKFDFKVDGDDESPFNVDLSKDEKCASVEEVTEPLVWYESEEVLPEAEHLENLDVYRLNAKEKNCCDINITYVVSGFLLPDVTKDADAQCVDISRAEEQHSDLLPGVYEGGAKIWECTDDLLDFMDHEYTSEAWQGKRVLDLGCGAGLLGIYAYKTGAIVHFQDYNADVLRNITIPNVLLNYALPPSPTDLNLVQLGDTVKFYSGDWQKFTQLTKNDAPYDLILSAETIYNPVNQQKLLDTFAERLSDQGTVLLAAKTYYFGVGGGLRQFEELIKHDKRFHSEVAWASCEEGVSREILKLKRLGPG